MNYLQVEKSDITRIGNQAFNENGYLGFICSGETWHIECILLRSILRCFGDYEILEENDFFWGDDDEADVEILTNLPYSIYEEASKSAYRAWKEREQSNQR